jgi:hypothetical protein
VGAPGVRSFVGGGYRRRMGCCRWRGGCPGGVMAWEAPSKEGTSGGQGAAGGGEAAVEGPGLGGPVVGGHRPWTGRYLGDTANGELWCGRHR